MIHFTNGAWAQYDPQIGTFRGAKDGIVYGNFTGEYATAGDLLSAMGQAATTEQAEELQAEYVADTNEEEMGA